MNKMQASRKLRHVTCYADTVIPSSVMTIISPGKTSRTLSNPMGPKAQSSDATHHSSPLSDFLLPRTSGLDNIHCPCCKHLLAYKSTVTLQRARPITIWSSACCNFQQSWAEVLTALKCRMDCAMSEANTCSQYLHQDGTWHDHYATEISWLLQQANSNRWLLSDVPNFACVVQCPGMLCGHSPMVVILAQKTFDRAGGSC